MQLTIIVCKTCGMRHGTIEGCFDVDDRGLTAAIAERKARELAGKRFAGETTQLSLHRMDPPK